MSVDLFGETGRPRRALSLEPIGTTPTEMSDGYAEAFPKRHALVPLQVVREGVGQDEHDVLYGTWIIGAAYANASAYYGAYPRGYLDRVMALFPDVVPSPDTVLHLFSGSLPAGPYSRCDMQQEAEYRCTADQLPTEAAGRLWRLVLADPPYSAADAERYDTPMVHRGKAMRALAQVTAAGGHVVWLDTVWPMHRKDEWRTVGRITLVRSTNHRVRMVTIFERRPTP